MKQLRSILLIGLEGNVARRLAEDLEVHGLFCEAASVEEAYELVEVVPYDAAIASFPFPRELPLARFLTRLRKRASASRHAALVLVADEFSLPEAHDLVGRGANDAYRNDVAAGVVAEGLNKFAAAAPRVSLVTLLQLEVPTSTGTRRVAAQCENISATGMFVRMEHSVPLGGEVSFELVIPGQLRKVRGRAVVVRHRQGQQGVRAGVALHFEGFEADGLGRVEEYVTTRLSGTQ